MREYLFNWSCALFIASMLAVAGLEYDAVFVGSMIPAVWGIYFKMCVRSAKEPTHE